MLYSVKRQILHLYSQLLKYIKNDERQLHTSNKYCSNVIRHIKDRNRSSYIFKSCCGFQLRIKNSLTLCPHSNALIVKKGEGPNPGHPDPAAESPALIMLKYIVILIFLSGTRCNQREKRKSQVLFYRRDGRYKNHGHCETRFRGSKKCK